jgi:superfamily II DNA helicase RecQ
MALTATANQLVRDDVVNRLGIRGCLLLQQSFNRPNLNYEVRHKTNGVVGDIAEWIRKTHNGHSGVIYARTKLDCEKISKELQEKYSISAEFYHADLDSATKKKKLNDWLDGKVKIMVATVSSRLS